MENTEKKSKATILRQKAEEQLNKKAAKTVSQPSEMEMLKLVHELEVHQIELEMQQDELILANERAEKLAANKYAELYDFAPTGYFTLSNDGIIIDLNLAASQMLGKDRVFLVKSRYCFFVSEDTKPFFNTFLEKVFHSKTKESCEVALTTNGNAPLYVHLTGIVSENGEQCYITTVDITERKQMEESIRESEAKFRLLFNSGRDSIAVHKIGKDSRPTNFTHVNDVACARLGYTREEMLTMSPQDIDAPDRSAQMPAIIEKLVKEKQVLFETEHISKNGLRIPVEVSTVLFQMENDLATISVARDITERKRAEGNLQDIIEKNPMSIQIVDKDGFTLKVNQAYTLLFGAVPPSDYSIFAYLQSKSEAMVKLILLAKSGETVLLPDTYFNAHDVFSKLPDVPVWIRATIFSLKDSGGKPERFVLMHDNITERKNSEQALRQAQKLESIGTLAGGIAHDFNNLMNAVLGQSGLALHKLPKESPAASHIAKAIKASERVADLTKQLLAYSGRGKFVIDEIDLNKLVKENVQILEVSIPKFIKLRYEYGTPSPHIKGDISQIQQVIMNLIINAGEAIDPNPGTIIVHTGRIEISEETSEYSNYTTAPLVAGSYAVLKVKDSGSGISVETLTRIFDPFFTTKFSGRGLGLAAVLGIIKGHKGGLRIKSEVGKGALFEIVFPLIAPSKTSPVLENEKLSAVNGEGKTILVIDDETSVIELLEDVLLEVNFKVISALDPLKGIEIYQKNHQNISLVILDYSMPYMDGKATFEELIKINKDVKVLLCSGYAEEETLSVFGLDRPTGYFQKPYNTEDLVQRVAEIVSKES